MKRFSVIVASFLASLTTVALADVPPQGLQTTEFDQIGYIEASGSAVSISKDAQGQTVVKLSASNAADGAAVDNCFKLAVVAKATGKGLTVMHIPPQFGNAGSKPHRCRLH